MNVQWNHRGSGTGGNPAHDSFDGILLQRWSETEGLIGEVHNIYTGSERGLTEAPHLFKRNNWYYLTVAEGGTGYRHAVTMARSRHITGPYETQPDGHLFTVTSNNDHPIQRTGHGQYVETHWGDVYHSFLMGRPLAGTDGRRYCPMGRETGLEKCVWGDDDWLYSDAGTPLPRQQVPAPGDETVTEIEPAGSDIRLNHRFSAERLPIDFQWLRTPEPDRLFRLENNRLVLIGRGKHRFLV